MAEVEAAYTDGCTAARHLVTASVEDAALRIRGDGVSDRWPFPTLMTPERLPEGQVVFRRRGSDARLLADLDGAARLLAEMPARFGPKARARVGAALTAALVAFALGLMAFVFVGLPALSQPAARATPVSVEVRLGRQTLIILDRMSSVCELPEAARHELDALMAALKTAADPPMPVSLDVVQAPMPNAFAVAGGRILVTASLIEMMEGPDELAGVLAHEMAHVSRRHVMAAWWRQMGTGAIIDLLLGGGGGAGQEIMRAGSTFEGMRHSRSAEQEADELAVAYLLEAGYDPEGLARFFDRLSDLHGRSPRFTALLSTHPDTAFRAGAVRQLAEAEVRRDWTPAMSEAGWRELSAACASETAAGDVEEEAEDHAPEGAGSDHEV